MELLQNKPSHFTGREKICLQTKFELSRWTLAPKKPNFLFGSLNKLGPLVDYFKIALSDPAHTLYDHLTEV